MWDLKMRIESFVDQELGTFEEHREDTLTFFVQFFNGSWIIWQFKTRGRWSWHYKKWNKSISVIKNSNVTLDFTIKCFACKRKTNLLDLLMALTFCFSNNDSDYWSKIRFLVPMLEKVLCAAASIFTFCLHQLTLNGSKQVKFTLKSPTSKSSIPRNDINAHCNFPKVSKILDLSIKCI